MRSRAGFTLVELIVAVTVLTVGLLSLVGASGLVTQMLGNGKRASQAAFYAQEQLETIVATGCNAPAGGPVRRGNGYELSWTLTPPTGGTSQLVRLLVRYPSRPGRMRTDTIVTSLLCIR